MSETGELTATVTTEAPDSQRVGPHSVGPALRVRLLFAIVFTISALYLWQELRRTWIPADDGALAESAERVLQGALPHRDFHEIYTGLLSYLNALSFQMFGTSLASMRYMLFLFSLAWVATNYYVLSRFVSAPLTGVLTLLAVVWGPPNCATPAPSWYNLFFATFGLAAMLRYIEVQTRRWLVIAGICGGVSFLFKMTGLYYVAGMLLFLLFRDQPASNQQPLRVHWVSWHKSFVVLSVFAYEALLLAVLHRQANVATYFYFYLPNVAIGATIICYEFYVKGQQDQSFWSVFREVLCFGAGVALPVAIFLTPYLWTGSLGLFFTDLFIQPAQMIKGGSFLPPVHWFVEGSVVNVLLIGGIRLTRSSTSPKLWEMILLGTPLALLIPFALFLAQRAQLFYQLLWATFWVLAPFAVVIGVGFLIRHCKDPRLDSSIRQRLFVTLSVTAVCSLIQFPFSDTYYYCFVAPLVLLSMTALISQMDQPPKLAVGGMICLCFLYAVFELTPGTIFHLGVEYAPDIQKATLSLPRVGGLHVSEATAHAYEDLDSLVKQHARGETILAAPRCPDVYFLSGLRPPNNDFWGFASDFGRETEDILRTLQVHHVNLVVLNHEDSIFVAPIPADLHRALEQEFPSHKETGDFEVRWKP